MKAFIFPVSFSKCPCLLVSSFGTVHGMRRSNYWSMMLVRAFFGILWLQVCELYNSSVYPVCDGGETVDHVFNICFYLQINALAKSTIYNF